MKAYILQVLHHVEEHGRVLVLVAHLLDGLPGDQVLADLGPHVLGRRGPRGPAVLVPLDVDLDLPLAVPGDALAGTRSRLGRGRAGCRGGSVVPLGDELRAPDAAVLGPAGVRAPAADAVHAHALRAGGHVDDGPVPGGAVPGFAMAAARVDLGGQVLGLLVDGGPERRG